MLLLTNGCCGNSCSCLPDEDNSRKEKEAPSGGMDGDMIAPSEWLERACPKFQSRIIASLLSRAERQWRHQRGGPVYCGRLFY